MASGENPDLCPVCTKRLGVQVRTGWPDNNITIVFQIENKVIKEDETRNRRSASERTVKIIQRPVSQILNITAAAMF